jgi:phosphoenolpyruvate carboxykinase (ATP)
MEVHGVNPSQHGLEHHGIRNVQRAFWNLGTAALVEQAVCRGEARLANNGALVATTGKHTGRSPLDKFIVQDGPEPAEVWWGSVNRPFEPGRFEQVRGRLLAHLQGRDLFVQDLFVGADPRYRLPVRVITELAWHSLFARQLFIRPAAAETGAHVPRLTVVSAPTFKAEPERDGTRSEVFILVHFGQGLVLIGGTGYAGEIKKSIFSILNYLLPRQGIVSMHCSANVGPAGDVALFFGLSGTGKTTLSADPGRRLIGDDEHGWSDGGVFNFEGGCYAKCIKLSREHEPQIWNAIRFGAVLENVVLDPATGELDYASDALTENTRAAYPVEFIDDARIPGTAGHATNVCLLTCDAFGILPPIGRLTPEQAMYHFLSGYTAKVAGTEAGMGSEPEATFSSCFGAPFLTLPPSAYARLLGERIAKHGATCWLVNTGWNGGPYGVGRRISLPHTRAILRAALDGRLADAPVAPDPVFGVLVPGRCPEVPAEILSPRNTWADRAGYDARARELAARFAKNFAQFRDIPEAIRQAGPRVD